MESTYRVGLNARSVTFETKMNKGVNEENDEIQRKGNQKCVFQKCSLRAFSPPCTMDFKRKQGENYPGLRCGSSKCRKEVGYFVGTWFEGTHLKLKEIFHLSYLWSRQTHSVAETMFDMQRPDGSTVSTATVVDFNNFSGKHV